MTKNKHVVVTLGGPKVAVCHTFIYFWGSSATTTAEEKKKKLHAYKLCLCMKLCILIWERKMQDGKLAVYERESPFDSFLIFFFVTIFYSSHSKKRFRHASNVKSDFSEKAIMTILLYVC